MMMCKWRWSEPGEIQVEGETANDSSCVEEKPGKQQCPDGRGIFTHHWSIEKYVLIKKKHGYLRGLL